MNKTLVLIAIIISLGIMGASSITANAKKTSLELERAQKIELMSIESARVEKCEEIAFKSYQLSWNAQCAGMWLEDGCLLPRNTGEMLNQTLEADKDRCYK